MTERVFVLLGALARPEAARPAPGSGPAASESEPAATADERSSAA